MNFRIFSLVIGSLFADISHASLWNFQDIYIPGSVGTALTDINNQGMMIGFYGKPNESRPTSFLIDNGYMIDIPMQYAYGINDSGDIVGTSVIDNVTHGQLFRNGILTSLDVPNASSTQLWGINDSGVILGNYWVIDPSLNTIIKSSTFTYSNGVFFDVSIPGYDNVWGIKIGNDGTIYGGTAAKGFMLEPDGTLNLSAYNYSYNSYFSDGNANGQVVGWTGNGGISDLSFVYENGIYIPIDNPYSSQTQAYGINDAGNVVGYWVNAGVPHGFLATRGNGIADSNSVPEPESLALMGLGFSAMAWAARRRKHDVIRRYLS
jgi:probable HAF family extracellular repeat protein